jgi:hypothetical protein
MDLKLSLVPPGVVSDRITVTALCGLYNDEPQPVEAEVKLYVDGDAGRRQVGEARVTVPASSAVRARLEFPTSGLSGACIAVATARSAEAREPLTVKPSDVRSPREIGGAWAGIEHWSDREGAPWNSDIRTMTDRDWRELVHAMHEIRMDAMVIQECLRNECYVGRHDIETNGYHGKAFYPSRLFPERMKLASDNPIEAILSEADELGVKVFLGVGMYAWFDFSAGSLAWHKKVASELFELFGGHRSFYGWYISAEVFGNLGDDDSRREDIVRFFTEFQAHVQSFAPEKPVMLAPNCHQVLESNGYYPKLLPHLDVLCPFGFHRMPEGDQTGEESAAWLQRACDEAGTHFWMDMEAFIFGPDEVLLPRPVEGLISDMNRFPNFEKILCYQFPGLLTSPAMRVKLGGDEAVKLHQDYKAWLGAGS